MSGNADKLILNEKWSLKIESNTYILKTLMSLRLSRQKTRRAIAAGPSLTFGAGDHGLDATLDLSTDQIPTLVALNLRNANGKMPESAITLIATALDATTATLDFDGVLSVLDFGGTGNDGRLEAIIHIDITSDAPTVS